MTNAEKFKGMALGFERKADEAAASDKPWVMGNLRTYQNFASKYWGLHYAAVRAESVQS